MSSRIAQQVAARQPYQQLSAGASDSYTAQPTYTGAYGRDGPPSSRVVRPVPQTYHPKPPSGLHVDTTRQPGSRPLYSPLHSPGGGYNGGSNSPPPPSYSDGGHSPPQGYVSAPPKAAFVEPPLRSPLLPDAAAPGVHFQETADEKAARGFRSDEEPPQFWKRMSGAVKQQQAGSSSEWLSQQSGKQGKLKTWSWIVAILVLAAIGGSLGYHFMNQDSSSSLSNSPDALSWANGASEVPTMFASKTAPSAALATPTVQGLKRKRHFGGHAQAMQGTKARV